MTAQARQHIHRLKAGAVSQRKSRDETRHCPHRTCVRSQTATVMHTFRLCPHAAALWTELTAFWTERGVAFNQHTALSIFLMRLPRPPHAPRRQQGDPSGAMPGQAGAPANRPHVPYRLANLAWQTLRAVALTRIWRTRALPVANDPWTDLARGPPAPAAARAILCSRNELLIKLLNGHTYQNGADSRHVVVLRRFIRATQFERRARADAIWPPTNRPPQPHSPVQLSGVYVLCFNGGGAGTRDAVRRVQ